MGRTGHKFRWDEILITFTGTHIAELSGHLASSEPTSSHKRVAEFLQWLLAYVNPIVIP